MSLLDSGAGEARVVSCFLHVVSHLLIFRRDSGLLLLSRTTALL